MSKRLRADLQAQAEGIRAAMNAAGGILADQGDSATLLTCAALFETWQAGVTYAAGAVLRYGGQ